MLEAATGTGKTAISIRLINNLCNTLYEGKKTKMLLLVAKRVHKQTWKEEFEKWGGIKVNEVVMECYESLKNHTRESFTFVVLDEVHHVKSEARRQLLKTIKYDYMLGLSATIPKKLMQYLVYNYHAQVVKCSITEAIEDAVLPEPEILLLPLELNNTLLTETWEINAKVKGPVLRGTYRDRWKLKKQKVHAIISMTQKQKLMEFDSLIQWEKERYMRTRNVIAERSWLYHCGERLRFLSDCKVSIVKYILKRLEKERTITFCKTIEQCEELGSNCIHSKNADSSKLYEQFNQKKIDHITAVNILNENANLVDCKYAVFTNLSSSEVVSAQRVGRSLRHKHPTIIIPYYKDTREEEIAKKMIEDYNKDFIKTINISQI